MSEAKRSCEFACNRLSAHGGILLITFQYPSERMAIYSYLLYSRLRSDYRFLDSGITTGTSIMNFLKISQRARACTIIKKCFPFITRRLSRWGRYGYPSRLDRAGKSHRERTILRSMHLSIFPRRIKRRSAWKTGRNAPMAALKPNAEDNEARSFDAVTSGYVLRRVIVPPPAKGQIKVSYVNDGE